MRGKALDRIEVNIVCSGYLGLLGRIMLTFVLVTVNLAVGFGRLMEQDQELHQKILLYEPVWLDSLTLPLKAMNVKFSVKELVNYLDEKVSRLIICRILYEKLGIKT